jgi:hypothetical protein
MHTANSLRYAVARLLLYTGVYECGKQFACLLGAALLQHLHLSTPLSRCYYIDMLLLQQHTA